MGCGIELAHKKLREPNVVQENAAAMDEDLEDDFIQDSVAAFSW